MKKILLLLVLLISFSTYSNAQNYTEVVYLKNGSVIKGVIIEQIPNVSLKVKTTDGSLIICNMSDVEKITKEESQFVKNVQRSSAKPALKGYKGFVDLGYLADLSDNNAGKIEVSTAHGYQFNNYIFLGAGMAVDYFNDADLVSVPLFVNFRVNFINKKITPFADFKTGYSAGDVEGAYVSLGMGARFSAKGKKAINVRLEYNFQQYDYSYSYSSGNYHGTYEDYLDLQGFGFKVGFEF